MPEGRKKGLSAEAAVATYLESRGVQVLVRNFRGRRGEIDLVVRDGPRIAFVEVKARRAGVVPSLQAVDVRKQRRIVAAALEYVARRRLYGVPLRFDVAAVVLDSDGRPRRVAYVPDAFSADGFRGRASV